MIELLSILFGYGWIRRRQNRRALEHLRTTGTLHCGLRVVDGHVPGLTREWTHGRWTLAPGTLTLLRTSVHITGVDDGFREPSAREAWGVHPDAQIVTAHTPTGRLEWALLPATRDAAVALVQR